MYKGRGNSADYEHSLEFLNDVFFSDNEPGDEQDFLSLLPKLYKKEYNHCENNFIVSVNGEWKGAVGLYYSILDIAGHPIKCAGIGNVAVGKDCRGKGYMKDCMKMAMNDAVESDADIALLGGQRQRYGYFSFEPSGTEYTFEFNELNLRHVYGSGFKSGLTVKEVKDTDDDALDYIYNLHSQNPIKAVRDRDQLFDILCTWCRKPLVFLKDGEFVGYCLMFGNFNCVDEIAAENIESFRLIVPALLEFTDRNSIKIRLSPHQKEYLDYLFSVCERSSIAHFEMMTVFNWKRFVNSLLTYKAGQERLCDGAVSFLIHGYKKDETFSIVIKDNEVTVTDGVESPVELTHKEAMELFTSLYSIKKFDLAPNVAQWFPIEFRFPSADRV